MQQARIVISGLSGGSGKTLVSLGLSRLFTMRGYRVQACKKGPDYIDYAWLALASKRPAACLDPYFLSDTELLAQFCRICAKHPSDIAIIEGNRGIFDGRDREGSCSTAHVARLLRSPVILTMNCAKMTRTAAAIVSGIAHFEPDLHLSGVILNNVAGTRHGRMLRQAIEDYTDIPVLGILPRLEENPLPERHMGLSLDAESGLSHDTALDHLAEIAAEHINTETVFSLASSAPPLSYAEKQEDASSVPLHRPCIGYVRDKAFWFYYQENLDALQEAGADLIQLDMFSPSPWPHIDGLYLGGGYPELFAEELSSSPHLAEIKNFALSGLPVYAECGGFMLLGKALLLNDKTFPMAGVFPSQPQFYKRPQGLGYVTAKVIAENPFHPVHSVWKGHEFHYSRCEWQKEPLPSCCLELSPGKGMYEKSGISYDGLLCGNTFASWTHLFAPAVPHWAKNFVLACSRKTSS
ncbi:MAG: cobyrinate a,c-diamide synthase [Mailhella sp.]